MTSIPTSREPDRVPVEFDPDTLAELRELANEDGVSTDEFVRACVEVTLRERRADLARVRFAAAWQAVANALAGVHQVWESEREHLPADVMGDRYPFHLSLEELMLNVLAVAEEPVVEQELSR